MDDKEAFESLCLILLEGILRKGSWKMAGARVYILVSRRRRRG